MKLIKNYADLHYLHIRLYKYDIYRKLEKYKAVIPQWDADENKKTTEMINKYSKKCGCASGKFAVFFVFVLYALKYYKTHGTFVNVGWYQLILVTIICLCGAIAGKLLGLIYARWQLIKYVHKLIS